jgi:AcrR family transcriptional regulator
MQQTPDDELRGAGEESPADDTRRRILLAAAQVFSENGYARATTRALAAAAGVNEVTLFRHFGSKENLFSAVIEQFASPAVRMALEAQITGDSAQDLRVIGMRLLNLLLERKDALRLMLCEATHFPEVQQALVQNPRQIRHTLASYITRQIERGRFRAVHPEVAAQAFSGMLFAYAIAQGLLDDTIEPQVDTEELVDQFVDIFMNGMVKRDE